jgi:hypothetical protein
MSPLFHIGIDLTVLIEILVIKATLQIIMVIFYFRSSPRMLQVCLLGHTMLGCLRVVLLSDDSSV